MKTAIILGATGLTGSILLQKLLEDDKYETVKVFTRRSVGFKHQKLEEHILDLFELEKYEDAFTGDVVFCCIGTTKSKTPDNETYRKVDYGIPLNAAKLAKKNGISKFLVISALGANSRSHVLYNRLKGEMERDVLAEKPLGTYIFEPSLIGGEREETRVFESLGKKLMKIGNKLLTGRLKKYRSIEAETIATAMIAVAERDYRKTRLESDEIKEVAKTAE